jgi:hypothetical protein
VKETPDMASSPSPTHKPEDDHVGRFSSVGDARRGT